MRARVTTIVAGMALAAGFAAAPVAAQAAPVAAAAYSCHIDRSAKVEADWLRVHVSPSVGSNAVGQLPGGAVFHYCSSSGRRNPKPAHYWYYGYGYHGSTKLTGWVDASYLNYGP